MLTNDQLFGFVRRSIYADESKISDEQLTDIIDQYLESIGRQNSKRCLILYNSILSALDYLANVYDIELAASTGGALKRSEKVGQVQVDIDHGDSLYSSNPWRKLRDDYYHGRTNVISCPVIAVATDNILIGNVSKHEIHRVKCNPDSVNGLQGLTNKRHWDLRSPHYDKRGF